jgi:hypothetical protein
VPIAGTPYTLNYASNRVRGRKTGLNLEIPLSGDSVPASLKRIELEVDVAGRHVEEVFSPTPNQTKLFEWDGLDAFGRPVLNLPRFRGQHDYVADAAIVERSSNSIGLT